nr:hypothetical protein Y48C3A.o - Caenorhabditis elegans [Caenorhabditis elegans]
MGESFTQAVVEGPQPKPSRFQFVPVPGEFTRKKNFSTEKIEIFREKNYIIASKIEISQKKNPNFQKTNFLPEKKREFLIGVFVKFLAFFGEAHYFFLAFLEKLKKINFFVILSFIVNMKFSTFPRILIFLKQLILEKKSGKIQFFTNFQLIYRKKMVVLNLKNLTKNRFLKILAYVFSEIFFQKIKKNHKIPEKNFFLEKNEFPLIFVIFFSNFPPKKPISVFFKLRQQQQEPEPEPEPPQPPPQESTIQVTSVKSTRPDTGDPGDSEVVTTDSTESIIITRKNGVTIVRKTSNSLLLPDEKYDQIRQLSIDDFENKEKKQQVPPTPMNTPPASLAVVDTSIQSTTSETTPGHSSSRKPSKEDSSPFDASSATPAPSQLETPQQQKPTTTRHFQVEPVVLSEPSTPAPVAPAPSIETLTSTSPPVTQQLAPSLSEPTFQVIQTEESKNMSMDSVKNVVDAAALSAPAPAPLSQSDRLNHVDEVEGTTPSNVMITVSSAAAALEKKEEAAFAAAGSLDSCGIPISGGGAAAQTSAPHSTPYGTPKDTHIQQQQQPVVFEEILTANGPPPQPSSPLLPALITTTTSAPTIAPASSPIINASGSSIPAASTSGISLFPSGGVTSSLTTPSTTADTHTPIDNKIEQAMELVKTHLTYAVREEVDTLRNTIAELEYQTLKQFPSKKTMYSVGKQR